jgi:hypothetical protein
MQLLYLFKICYIRTTCWPNFDMHSEDRLYNFRCSLIGVEVLSYW